MCSLTSRALWVSQIALGKSRRHSQFPNRTLVINRNIAVGTTGVPSVSSCGTAGMLLFRSHLSGTDRDSKSNFRNIWWNARVLLRSLVSVTLLAGLCDSIRSITAIPRLLLR
jgi:hypothetical protein